MTDVHERLREAVESQLGVERPRARRGSARRTASASPPTFPSALDARAPRRAARARRRVSAVAAGTVLARRRRRRRRRLAQRPALGRVRRSTCRRRWRACASSTSAPTPAMTPSCSGKPRRGRVLACEPFEFIEQARLLEAIYRSGRRLPAADVGGPRPGVARDVRPRALPRGALPRPASDGARADGCASMLAPGGTLFFGSIMLGSTRSSRSTPASSRAPTTATTRGGGSRAGWR